MARDRNTSTVQFPSLPENEWAHSLIEKLSEEKFYGDLKLSFREGRIYIAGKRETIKPS